MAYRSYNTRNSGRFNTPGQFVSAGELSGGAGSHLQGNNTVPQRGPQQNNYGQQQQQQQQQQQPQQQKAQNIQTVQQLRPMQAPPLPPLQPSSASSSSSNLMSVDVKNEDMDSSMDSESTGRPHWMKTKNGGVKKISNKERRRRQNENLRRLLTPKNALMVLNEMLPNEQIANQFKVEPTRQLYKPPNTPSFCADLTLEGNTYKGFGENKLMARNAAAEQAIRDLIIRKMAKAVSQEVTAGGGAEGAGGAGVADGGAEEAGDSTETLPMIQLASFALHKLFSEWEYEGHKVPQLKPTTTSESGTCAGSTEGLASSGPPAPRPPRPPKVHSLPQNASAMHPSMLLTYMRSGLEYRELAAEGDRPQNMMFTIGIDVDGATYIGKASNKKEARKQAAKAACQSLFNVTFDEVATANVPVV